MKSINLLRNILSGTSLAALMLLASLPVHGMETEEQIQGTRASTVHQAEAPSSPTRRFLRNSENDAIVCFKDLPPEILPSIAEYLSYPDTVRFGTINRQGHDVLNSMRMSAQHVIRGDVIPLHVRLIVGHIDHLGYHGQERLQPHLGQERTPAHFRTLGKYRPNLRASSK